MKDDWRKANPFPEREQRAMEALEIATNKGVPHSEIISVYRAIMQTEVFSWCRCTDEQLAGISSALRILAEHH
jgi:hypothetical protein